MQDVTAVMTRRITRVLNQSRNTTLADRALVAETFLIRGWGLLGRCRLDAGEGMIFPHTSGIHSIFMRFAFDAVYVARDGRIRRLLPHFAPYRFGPVDLRTYCVLELPAGTIAGSKTAIGDAIRFDPPL